jgi:hypothetical protein
MALKLSMSLETRDTDLPRQKTTRHYIVTSLHRQVQRRFCFRGSTQSTWRCRTYERVIEKTRAAGCTILGIETIERG